MSAGTRKMLIGQSRGIAAGFRRHVAELLEHAHAVPLQPVVAGDPAVAVADRAPRGIGEGAADDDRRMRLLRRLRPLLHLAEIDELAVIFGLFLGPDGLHRLDSLARQFVPALEFGAVVLDLLLVPAIADAEQEAAVGKLVDGGNHLRGDDRIALGHQGDAGADPELRRHGRRGIEGQERIHQFVIGLDQSAARRIGRLARGRNVRVFGHPQGFETAFLQRAPQRGRLHGVRGEEHHCADFHGSGLPLAADCDLENAAVKHDRINAVSARPPCAAA